MGRNWALDEVKRAQICTMVALGCSRRAAARYVGCSSTTIRHTAMHNRQFREQLREAERQAEITPLENLRAHAAKNWRAAAWLLSRTHAWQYGHYQADAIKTEDVSEMIGGMFQELLKEEPSAETRQRMARRFEQWRKDLGKDTSSCKDPLYDGRRPKKKSRLAALRLEPKPPGHS